MTDQAPSFAEQLEQEAGDLLSVRGELLLSPDSVVLLAKRLTRAAALAKAAEEWQRLHDVWWQNGGERRGRGPRLVDLAWAENQLRRALVSAAGQGE